MVNVADRALWPILCEHLKTKFQLANTCIDHRETRPSLFLEHEGFSLSDLRVWGRNVTK